MPTPDKPIPDIKPGIGERIKNLRLSKGEDQADVAAASGCARSYVSAIEVGRKLPGRRVLARIAEHFQVPMEFLVKGDTGAGQAVVSDPRDMAIVRLLRQVAPETRDAVLTMLRAAAKAKDN